MQREIRGIYLKACPFCGHNDEVHLFEDMQLINGDELIGVRAHIDCYWCSSSFTQLEANGPEEVAEAWNKRPN